MISNPISFILLYLPWILASDPTTRYFKNSNYLPFSEGIGISKFEKIYLSLPILDQINEIFQTNIFSKVLLSIAQPEIGTLLTKSNEIKTYLSIQNEKLSEGNLSLKTLYILNLDHLLVTLFNKLKNINLREKRNTYSGPPKFKRIADEIINLSSKTDLEKENYFLNLWIELGKVPQRALYYLALLTINLEKNLNIDLGNSEHNTEELQNNYNVLFDKLYNITIRPRTRSLSTNKLQNRSHNILTHSTQLHTQQPSPQTTRTIFSSINPNTQLPHTTTGPLSYRNALLNQIKTQPPSIPSDTYLNNSPNAPPGNHISETTTILPYSTITNNNRHTGTLPPSNTDPSTTTLSSNLGPIIKPITINPVTIRTSKLPYTSNMNPSTTTLSSSISPIINPITIRTSKLPYRSTNRPDTTTISTSLIPSINPITIKNSNLPYGTIFDSTSTTTTDTIITTTIFPYVTILNTPNPLHHSSANIRSLTQNSMLLYNTILSGKRQREPELDPNDDTAKKLRSNLHDEPTTIPSQLDHISNRHIASNHNTQQGDLNMQNTHKPTTNIIHNNEENNLPQYANANQDTNKPMLTYHSGSRAGICTQSSGCQSTDMHEQRHTTRTIIWPTTNTGNPNPSTGIHHQQRGETEKSTESWRGNPIQPADSTERNPLPNVNPTLEHSFTETSLGAIAGILTHSYTNQMTENMLSYKTELQIGQKFLELPKDLIDDIKDYVLSKNVDQDTKTKIYQEIKVTMNFIIGELNKNMIINFSPFFQTDSNQLIISKWEFYKFYDQFKVFKSKTTPICFDSCLRLDAEPIFINKIPPSDYFALTKEINNVTFLLQPKNNQKCQSFLTNFNLNECRYVTASRPYITLILDKKYVTCPKGTYCKIYSESGEFLMDRSSFDTIENPRRKNISLKLISIIRGTILILTNKNVIIPILVLFTSIIIIILNLYTTILNYFNYFRNIIFKKTKTSNKSTSKKSKTRKMTSKSKKKG